MNQNEKICSAFRQDIELPAIVTQKADAAFEQILSESHKEKDKMKEEQKNTRKKSQKKKVPVWVKATTAAAAFVLLFLGICSANPVLAAKIPVIGRIFSMLQKTSEYPGDYEGYAQPLEDPVLGSDEETTAEDPSLTYTQTVGDVTVTLSEVYCNQESLSISMLVESQEPFADKIMKNVDGRQYLSLAASNLFSFRAQDPYVGDKDLEGTFLDERTFAGIWRIRLDSVLVDDSELEKIVAKAEASGEEVVITDEMIRSHTEKLTLPEEFTVEIHLEKIVGDLAEPEKIDWGVSEEELKGMSDEAFQALYDEKMKEYGMDQYPNRAEHFWFEGPWDFTIPVSVNESGNYAVTVEEVNEQGVGLHTINVTPFEVSVDYADGGMDCIPIVFDAQGNRMENGSGDVSVLPIGDHAVNRMTVCICLFDVWKEDLLSHRGEADFLQYVKEKSLYSKELEVPVS